MYRRDIIIGDVFGFNSSLRYSKEFFEKLEEKYNKLELTSKYNVFNNGKEQGYFLTLDADTDLVIWCSKSALDKKFMIIIGCKNDMLEDGSFNEEKRSDALYFDDIDRGVEFVFKQIKYIFKNELKKTTHLKFDMYYSLEDIERITIDAKEFEYNDYYELASFFDEEEGYMCDLVIKDGKSGLKYSKKMDSGRFLELTFEKCKLTFESDISLLVDMKDNLNKFVDISLSEEIEKNIECLKKI